MSEPSQSVPKQRRTPYFEVVACATENTCLVADTQGGVFRTADGGGTWHGVQGLAGVVRDMRFLSPRFGYALTRHHAHDYVPYLTVDAGRSWQFLLPNIDPSGTLTYLPEPDTAYDLDEVRAGVDMFRAGKAISTQTGSGLVCDLCTVYFATPRTAYASSLVPRCWQTHERGDRCKCSPAADRCRLRKFQDWLRSRR